MGDTTQTTPKAPEAPANTTDTTQTTPPADTPSQPAWMSQLGGDLQKNEKLTSFGNLTELGKAFLELSEKQAASITLPDEKATQADWDAFYEKLGRPASPEQYELDAEKLPEGFNVDEGRLNNYRTLFHKLGLNTSQAKGLLEAAITEEQSAASEFVKQQTAAKEQAASQLKSEWGSDYDGNVAIAKKAVAKFGGEDLAKELTASGLGNNPALVKAFHAIGVKISDGKFIAGSTSQTDEGEFGKLQYNN